jgi:hypothetical protein
MIVTFDTEIGNEKSLRILLDGGYVEDTATFLATALPVLLYDDVKIGTARNLRFSAGGGIWATVTVQRKYAACAFGLAYESNGRYVWAIPQTETNPQFNGCV